MKSGPFNSIVKNSIGGRALRQVAAVCTLFCLAGLFGGCTGVGLPSDYEFPDNGQGTSNLPPVYIGPLTSVFEPIIIDGLPPDATIEVADMNIINMIPGPISPGGSLGGHMQHTTIQAHVHLRGTGPLVFFDRIKPVSLSVQVDSAPRAFFAPVQSFDTRIARVEGQLPPGDPDFDLLRIVGGDMFGMPSPGHATFTQVGLGWRLEASSDLAFRVDFVGRAGGPLTGMSGSTMRTKHIQTESVAPTLDIPPGASHLTTRAPAMVQFGGSSPLPPIPADFFYPGSEPFLGDWLALRCEPISLAMGNTDTFIQRMAPTTLPSIGSTQTVPIELLQLSLRSVDPIVVLPDLSEWDLHVTIEPAGPGQMHITRSSLNGGTFTAELPVRPAFTFTRWLPSEPVMSLPSPVFVTLQTTAPCSWSTLPLPGTPNGSGPGFYPTSSVDWTASGMTLRLGPANTIPSEATEAAVGDMNIDGGLDGLDVQGIAQVALTGPLDPRFHKVDANANGLFDADDMHRIVNILLATDAETQPPEESRWVNVAKANCDNSRQIILNCAGKKKKVIVRAADINEVASGCHVHCQIRDCQGVDVGDPVDMAPGATKCVTVGSKDQLVVWCDATGTSCKISYNITPCGPNP